MKNHSKYTFFVLSILLSFALVAIGQTREKRSLTEFDTFLKEVDAAQLDLQNGKAEPFKAVWSRADDVTLSGGFGGTVEKGWANVGARLDWVGANFSKGTNKIERIVTNQNGKLGYVIQLEHIDFIAPESGKAATRDYRVTMIFRREKNGWRIVHRQADSNNVKQAPK